MTIHQAIMSQGCGCDGQETLGQLISIDQALRVIAKHVTPVGRTKSVSLDSARGCILSRPVRSRAMVPAFDNAAMDGYAIATSGLTGNGPWMLEVVARVPAGQDAATALSGASAVRIFTGAPLPEGADAVVMQEELIRNGDFIQLRYPPVPGMNIRLAGSDMQAGATVLDEGRKLGPREIAACAAAGAGVVRVRPQLRVALLVTGDEVRKAGGARKAAQIWDVNTPMLVAALEMAGLNVIATSIGADNRKGLAQQMGDMAAQADLVITTGGISVGEEDHVKPALTSLGAEILFSGVAIKPGKPVSFGRIGPMFWLGLPGNPLSAFVTWQVFGTALIRALTGEAVPAATRRHVVTSASIRRKPGRCELRPVILDGFDSDGRETVRFEDATHSGRVSMLSQADGLMYLPADADYLPIGALVEFQPFCPI